MKRRLRQLALLLLLILVLSGGVFAEELGALVPVGETVYLELEPGGVYVTGFDETLAHCPAQSVGILEGDLIVSVDGQPLSSAEALSLLVQDSFGKPLLLCLERQGKPMSFAVQPVCRGGVWRLGVYVRDHITGIGTVTYYDPQNDCFAVLGHGVYFGDGAAPIRLQGGSVAHAQITEITKGKKGEPGALQGVKAADGGSAPILSNTEAGIFGICGSGFWDGSVVPCAKSSEICVGSAEILCSVDGSVRPFQIQIEAIRAGGNDGKNLELRVTDPELLKLTGGIVQGMSGSPILQNGKLIGAVTHVLVQDPTRGYGIVIERMLRAGAACSA